MIRTKAISDRYQENRLEKLVIYRLLLYNV